MKNFFTPPTRHPAFQLFLLSIGCCLFSSILSISTAQAQLQGTYTIGGADGDYVSFSEASKALDAEGVSGPVTFKIRAGTYNEQLVLGEIAGNTCEQFVSFEGESGNAEDVVVQASGYALQIQGANGLAFRYMTIHQVNITEGSNCISLENNRISGLLNSISGPGELANHHHRYRNNHISGGIRKVKTGEFNPGSPEFDEGLEITGNILQNSIELSAQKGIIINDNQVELITETETQAAIDLTNSWYGKEIKRNSIVVKSYYGRGIGIRTVNGIPEQVTENRIRMEPAETMENPYGDDIPGLGGGTAMLVSNGKTASGEVLIANNDLYVDGYDRRGELGSLAGLHIRENNSADELIKVYHNSIKITGYKEGYTSLTEANTFVAEAVADKSLHILNNIFNKVMDGGGGYTINILQPSSVAISDHNAFFGYATMRFAWRDQTVTSLEEWQQLTSMDENSITGGPYARKGIKVEEVDIDIEGKLRNNPPSIGAYELEEEEDRKPLLGTFTIGGADGNYADFNEAIAALQEHGISGPVTFQVRPGTYKGSFSIPNFWGNSCENKVTFEGASDSNTDVILEPSTAYTILLNEADGITFRNMSIIGSGNVIEIRPGTDCFTLENNILTVVPASAYLSTVIVDAQSTTTVFSHQHTYRNNIFINGEVGIRKAKDINLVQETSILDEGLIIEGNEFRNQKETGIFLAGQKDFRINRNIITQQSGGTGIQLWISLLGEEIIGNTIQISGGGTGMYTHFGSDDGVGIFAQTGAAKRISENKLILQEGGTGMYIDPGRTIQGEMLIANNLLELEAQEGQTNDNMDMVGLWIPETNWNVKVYHNSIRHTGDAINGKNTTFIADGTANTLHILNNSFVNKAGGYVISLAQPSAIAALDYNNLYTNGEILAKWNEESVATLSEWQALTDFDKHSLSVDPQVTAEDLIPSNPALDGSGIALQEISTDFYGKLRNDPPDIGAVEFEAETPVSPLTGAYTIGGEDGDFATFNEAVAALEERGVNGAVTFQVRAGDYAESISIGEFPGNSCEHPVVFEGSTADGKQVRLIDTQNSYTLQLKGADGITFRNMYIFNQQTTVAIQEGSNCFTLENNELRSSKGPIIHASSGPGEASSNQHRYRNNTFSGGTIGLQKINAAEWNANAPQRDEGLLIENNIFRDQAEAGIILSAQQGYRINHNTFTLESSEEHAAISITNSWYGEEIRGNVIRGSGGVSGIITNSGAPARVSENQIELRDGGTGMHILPGKTAHGEVLVANNRILIEGYEYEFNQNMSGLFVSGINENVVKVYHNSVRHIGYIINGGNLIFGAAGAENSVYIANNSFVDNSGGILLGLYGGEPAIAEMDYNNLYQWHEKGSFGFNVGGFESLEEWQKHTEHDTHSISVNPEENHLHEAFYQAGIYKEEVPLDLIGQQRQDPPSIGAVEILELPYRLSGTYTIGGSNAAYESFTEAVKALDTYGTSDSVLFMVRSGIYQEQLSIRRSHDPVTFAGESGDSTDVVLEYPDGYALRINGASHYTFRHLTISGQGAVLIEAEKNGIAAHLNFEHNILKSSNSTPAVATRNDATTELEYLNSAVNFLSFRNNFISGQGLGINKAGSWVQYLRGGHQFLSDVGLEISGNTFMTGTGGIFVIHTRNVVINDNTITVEGGPAWTGNTGISLHSSYQVPELTGNRITAKGPQAKGIHIHGGLGAALGPNVPEKLTGNHILLPEGGTGLLLEMVNGTYVNTLIANNMISVKGNEGSAGVVLDGFTFNGNFYFNSIFLYGEDTESKALSFPDEMSGNAFTGYNLHFANNIFANAAGGLAVHGQSSFSGNTSITTPWDHNAYYTNGELLIHWFGNDIASLSEWQALTGQDENSIVTDPQFESVENLIPGNPVLAGAGIAVESVTTDFFGQSRQDPPTIGAVEMEAAPGEPVAVIPMLDCISRNRDGSYTASFGYHNPNQQAISIPVGAENHLSLLEYAGQPQTFEPGRHEAVFYVVFEGEDLSWTLENETLTVDLNAPSCPVAIKPIEPLVACVSQLNPSTHIAQLGYHNPNSAPVAIAPGKLNRFNANDNLGQPTVFDPGHHRKAFYISFTGIQMWTLLGQRLHIHIKEQVCDEPVLPVEPILECVSHDGNGNYTAYFGYFNPNDVAVATSLKFHNHLRPAIPGPEGVPDIFEPGRHERVFSATFRGRQIQWNLLNTVVTANRSPALACEDTEQFTFDEKPAAQGDVKAFPVPFHKNLQLRISDNLSEKVDIRLYALSGMLLMKDSRPNSQEAIKLELEHLGAGIYILEVQTATMNKRIKVYKQ